MSSLRNAIPRRAHKERAQPQSRKKFGLLEKHKVYVVRAKAYHKKEETIWRLKEKAAFRNPDEFYFKMIKTKTVDGVHRLESQAHKYTQEELMLMKTQDIGYILQKLLLYCVYGAYKDCLFNYIRHSSLKNYFLVQKIEKLNTMLHSLDSNLSSRHVYYAEDREEAKEIKYISGRKATLPVFDDIPDHINRKTAASYRELEGRKKRVQELEKLFMDMPLQKELQKKGRKRKLNEEEIVCPSSKPVYISGGLSESGKEGRTEQFA